MVSHLLVTRNAALDLARSIQKLQPPVQEIPVRKEVVKPKFFLKAIHLKEGEDLLVEPGAMLALKNLSMKVESHGSNLIGHARRYLLGGENIWVNRFTAQKGGGWLSLEEQYDGQIVEVSIKKGDVGFKICHGAFIASTSNIRLNSRYEGFWGWLKGRGFGSIEATLMGEHEGKVYICTEKGQVRAICVEKGEPVIIDNENILAYSCELSTTLKKIGNTRSFLFGGEGFVTEFEGKGIILLGSGAITGQSTWLTKTISKAWEAVYEDAIPNGIVFLFGMAGTMVGNYIMREYFQEAGNE